MRMTPIYRLFSATTLALALALLTACSGGTTQAAQDAAVTSKTLAMTLVIKDSAGAAVTALSESQAVTIEARVTVRTISRSGARVLSDTTGPAANAIVTLAPQGGVVVPESGRILTDAQGLATARFTAGVAPGAFTLGAQATLETATNASASLNFQINRVVIPRLTLTLLDAGNRATQQLVAGTPVTVNALVEGVDMQVKNENLQKVNVPAANALVTFSTDGGVFDPTNATVLTDANGNARVRLLPNLQAGGFLLSATSVVGEGATRKEAQASLAYSVTVPQLQLGAGTPFAAGRLAADDVEIRAGDSTQITGEIRTSDGALYTLPVNVTFRSACQDNGAATLLSPVLAGSGFFRTTYRPSTGCEGADQIFAEATLPGQAFPLQASIIVRVLPAQPQAIQYVEASATSLALRGRGSASRPERADVRFRVTNLAGVAVQGAAVSFSLSRTAGGLSLLAPGAVTDAQGIATATVVSGTAAGSFRVIAALASPAVSAQSEALTVSTGTPDQDSISLSVSKFNIEAFNIDGESTDITIRAADHFNNPPADGTRLSFVTEGGRIPATCELTDGICTVQLTSQQPRPSNGRVSVLATAPGDESFTDANGNGQYDPGEVFDDLPEAFMDANENRQHDIGEHFADRNANGRRDTGNGVYDGALCPSGGGCQALSTVDVRASVVIVFSTSRARIVFNPGSLSVDELSPRAATVAISDENGNLPAVGSTIEISTNNGELLSEGSFDIGNSNAPGPLLFPILVVGDGEPSSGFVNVTVTSPSGVITMAQMPLTDTSVCATAPLPLPPGCEGGDADVSEVTLSPAQFTVQANDAARRVTVNIGVFAAGEAGRRPFTGIVPAVTCAVGTSSGITITPPATIAPTSSNGLTSAEFVIDAGAVPTGEVLCVVNAGDVESTLRFTAAPPTVGEVIVTPASFTVAPNLASATFNAQAAVYAVSGAGVRTPLPNVQVTVVCAGGGGTDFSVAGPVTVAPTSNQGITSLAFTVTSGAAPTGTATCSVSAGSQTTAVSFTP